MRPVIGTAVALLGARLVIKCDGGNVLKRLQKRPFFHCARPETHARLPGTVRIPSPLSPDLKYLSRSSGHVSLIGLPVFTFSFPLPLSCCFNTRF